MSIKYTKALLAKLEDIFSETEYLLRYEKGNFHSGYCILNDLKIAMINKYFPLDSRISSLIEILHTIDINTDNLSEKNRKLFLKITQTELQI